MTKKSLLDDFFEAIFTASAETDINRDRSRTRALILSPLMTDWQESQDKANSTGRMWDQRLADEKLAKILEVAEKLS